MYENIPIMRQSISNNNYITLQLLERCPLDRVKTMISKSSITLFVPTKFSCFSVSLFSLIALLARNMIQRIERGRFFGFLSLAWFDQSLKPLVCVPI